MSLEDVQVSVVMVRVARFVRRRAAPDRPDDAEDSKASVAFALALDLLVFGLARATLLFFLVWLIHRYWWQGLPALGWTAAYGIALAARIAQPGASSLPKTTQGGVGTRLAVAVFLETLLSVTKGVAFFLLVWLIHRFWWSGLPTVVFLPAIGIIASIRIFAGITRRPRKPDSATA